MAAQELNLKDFQIDLLSRRAWLSATAGFALCGLSGTLGAEMRVALRIEEAPEKHPLIPVLRTAADALKLLDEVQDYTTVFTKTELMGRKNVTTKLEMKFREKPRSVYAKFLDSHAGRQVIYNEGKNSNQLQVKDVGLASLVGTLHIDPKGKAAMEESRYPITMIGLNIMAETVIEQWLGETKIDGVTVNVYPDAKLGDQPATVIETSYGQQSTQTKYALTRIYIEKKSGLMVKVQNYDFPTKKNKDKPILVEDYYYAKIMTNVGLKDLDFDTRNPNYGF